jgi:hypothetical protein
MLDLNKDPFAAARHVMVRDHIEARGVRARNMLEAMRKAPREAFIPPSLHEFAYEDAPLLRPRAASDRYPRRLLLLRHIGPAESEPSKLRYS